MYSIKTPVEEVVKNIKKKYNINLEIDEKEKGMLMGKWLIKHGYKSGYKLLKKTFKEEK